MTMDATLLSMSESMKITGFISDHRRTDISAFVRNSQQFIRFWSQEPFSGLSFHSSGIREVLLDSTHTEDSSAPAGLRAGMACLGAG